MATANTAYGKFLRRYYDRRRRVYDSTYTGAGRYRSNYFRLRTVLRLLDETTPRPRRVLEAGCGNGRVLAAVVRRGFDVVGFDASDGMLEEARTFLRARRIDPARVRKGDVYRVPYPRASFDAVLCLGVIGSLPDHRRLFREFRRVLRPGGTLIVSVGNELFSLFSMNQHTVNFLDALYADIGVPKVAREQARATTSRWLRLDEIRTVRKAIATDAAVRRRQPVIPKYNALNVGEAFGAYGFAVEAVRFYHYHPLPPRFETDHPALFRVLAERLETTRHDWRGAVLCNAMVVRARVTPARRPRR